MAFHVQFLDDNELSLETCTVGGGLLGKKLRYDVVNRL